MIKFRKLGLLLWLMHFSCFLALQYMFKGDLSASGFCFADCGWFRSVIDSGYYYSIEKTNLVFFPTLPIIGKLLTFFGISASASLVLVSWISSFFIWQLIDGLFSNSKHNLYFLILIFLNPSLNIIYLGYSESLYILSVVFFIRVLVSTNFLNTNLSVSNFFCIFLVIFFSTGIRYNSIFTFISALIYLNRKNFKSVFVMISASILSIGGFYLYCFFISGDIDYYRNSQAVIWGILKNSYLEIFNFDLFCVWIYDRFFYNISYLFCCFLTLSYLLNKLKNKESEAKNNITLYVLSFSWLHLFSVAYAKGGYANYSGASRFLIPVFLINLYFVNSGQFFNNKIQSSVFKIIFYTLVLFFGVTWLPFQFKLSQKNYFEDPWLVFNYFPESLKQIIESLHVYFLCT